MIKTNKSLKNNILFIILLILLLAFKIYFCTQKQDFFVDEIFSYGLMNYHTAYIIDDEDFKNNWHDKEYFSEYITINKSEIFNLSPIINNQLEDYHPPFFYLCLRIAATFTVGSFTKWTGLILNLIIFLGCCIVVYKIGNAITKNKSFALILLAFYGFSKFSLENVLFIRMYQLLELLMLLLAYWNIKKYDKKDIEIKDLCSYIAIITLGCLTHYYFGLFLIGTLICNIIINIKRKNWKNIGKILMAFAITQILASILFPGYFANLEKSVYRTSEKEKITIIEFIKQKAQKMYQFGKLANEHLLFIEVKYIILTILIIGIIIFLIKKVKKERIQHNYKIIFIIIPSIVFWSAATATAPYIDLRYILPILVYPLILLIYLIFKELKFIISNEKIAKNVLSVIFIIYIICMPFNFNNIWYLFEGREKSYSKIKEYKDVPVIYFYDEKPILDNAFMEDYNFIKEFNNVYIMDRRNYTTKNLMEIIKNVDISNGLIIVDSGFNAYIEQKAILANIKNLTYSERIFELSTSMFSNEYYYFH